MNVTEIGILHQRINPLYRKLLDFGAPDNQSLHNVKWAIMEIEACYHHIDCSALELSVEEAGSLVRFEFGLYSEIVEQIHGWLMHVNPAMTDLNMQIISVMDRMTALTERMTSLHPEVEKNCTKVAYGLAQYALYIAKEVQNGL